MVRIRYIVIYTIVVYMALSDSVYSQYGKNYYSDRFKSISTQQGLSNTCVTCLSQDKIGYIWIGTRDGLNRFDGYNFITYKFDPQDTTSLSNNEITTICIGSDGNPWIGTRGGGLNLFQYRTNRFLRFSNLNYENTVRAVVESCDSVYWIGTTEGLLRFCFNSKTRKYAFNNVSRNAIFHNENGSYLIHGKQLLSVVALKKLSKDTLLVGTENGLFVYANGSGQFDRLDLGPANTNVVTSIFVEKQGTLWVGSYNGIIKAIPIKPGILKYKLTSYDINKQNENRLYSNRIEAITSDFFGDIWAGTRGGGLIKIEDGKKMHIYLNDPDNINGLSDDIVNSLLVDNTGMLWIGTESQGCNTIDLFRKKFYLIKNNPNNPNSLSDNLVTAITSSGNGIIWIGTANGGLDKLSYAKDESFKIEHFHNIPIGSNLITNEIISLFPDKDNVLWIGTATNRLCRFKEGVGFTSYYVNGFVFTIHEDRNGGLWYGTWGQGLGLIDKKTGRITRYSSNRHSLSSDKILTLFDDNVGNLWVGTKGGGVNVVPLKNIDQQQSEFVSYRQDSRNPKSLSHNDVLCITQDSRGVLWIGTGGGLDKVNFPKNLSLTDAILERKIWFTSYLEKDGLPSSVIYGIEEDKKGNLWLSTNNGISVFDPLTNKFKNYDVNDGLQANEFHWNAYFKDQNGLIYFGGVNGLTFFNPDSIKENPFKPRAVITNLKISNKSVWPGIEINGRVILKNDITNTHEIVLTYKEKEIIFEFSALHYANPQRINYEYRLVGFNDKWQLAEKNSRSATYTNLDEGSYTFQVKSTNNDGLWSDTPTGIKIVVLPPFWRNSWFYLVYTAIIVFLLIIFRKYSLIAVKEKNKLMIERFNHRKLVEMTEAKMRFFTNVSHEIRTPLTLIVDPLERVVSDGKIDKESEKNLKVVSKNVNRLLGLVNQLLQLQKIDLGAVYIKVSETDFIPFLKEIVGFFEHSSALRNISVTFKNEENNIQLWMDNELITTVFYNLISNAFKFTSDGGAISIKVYRYHGSLNQQFNRRINRLFNFKIEITKWIVVEIADTGKGIPEKELNNIFYRFYQINDRWSHQLGGSGIGLSLVKEYLELHKGKIEVISEPNKGSTFKVYIPEGSGHFFPNQIVRQSKKPVMVPVMEITGGNSNGIMDNETDEEEILKETEINNKEVKKEEPVILIIEDDYEMAKYLSEYLHNGYNVEKAYNGEKGLKMAMELLPDLVISDVMLPEMNGLDLCQTLKSNIETSHIPVILLTAKADEEHILRGYETGADIYITKPFNVKVLETQVKMLIESRNILKEKFSRQIMLEPREVTITSIDEKFLKHLIEVTEANLSDSEFDVSKLVEAMNMSHTAILRKFKSLSGQSLVEFIKSYRLKKAALILQIEKLPIAEVGHMVGFSDPKYFSKCFVKEFGKTPTDYNHEFYKEKG